MKLLWIADGGVASGFARVTHNIGERLIKDYGYDIWCLATGFNGDHVDTTLKLLVPNTIVPNDNYGQARFLKLAAEMEPDAIVFVNDPHLIYRFLFRNKYDPQGLLQKHFEIFSYEPIDGYSTPPQYGQISQLSHRIAMSKFGQAAMPGAPLIYHGVDTDQFWPVSPKQPITTSVGRVVRSKGDCKELIEVPRDAFLVGRVDSNSGRKDFGALWAALIPVMKRHSNVYAYFHCKPTGEDGGVNFPAVLSREPELADRFRFPGDAYTRRDGYRQQDLNAVYNAFDIFASTSRGEGFGLTLAEALACAVPVIAQNVSSIPEVVGPGGTLIEPERPITVPFGQDQMLADIPAFTAAIERAYGSAGWRRGTGRAGREHVSGRFSWDEAARLFDEHITEVLAHATEEQPAAVS